MALHQRHQIPPSQGASETDRRLGICARRTNRAIGTSAMLKEQLRLIPSSVDDGPRKRRHLEDVRTVHEGLLCAQHLFEARKRPSARCLVKICRLVRFDQIAMPVLFWRDPLERLRPLIVARRWATDITVRVGRLSDKGAIVAIGKGSKFAESADCHYPFRRAHYVASSRSRPGHPFGQQKFLPRIAIESNRLRIIARHERGVNEQAEAAFLCSSFCLEFRVAAC